MAVTITGTGDISVTGNIEGNNISANTNLLFGNKVQPQAGTSVTATGTYTSSTVSGDTVLIFTGNGTLTVSNMLGIPARILVVGGGGGGGYAQTGGGAGGGGAGQFIDTNIILPPGTIDIKIGAGGAGGARLYEAGKNGGLTSIGHIYALGGGGGGANRYSANDTFNSPYGRVGASTGGCHGVDVYSITELGPTVFPALAGNLGGRGRQYGGGGGGGAGTPGNTSNPTTAATNTGGNGGDGLISNITDTNVYYAAGGGGGAWSTATPGGVGGLGGGGNGSFGSVTGPTAGAPNTGSGGGGGNNYHGFVGAAGGSGIVIVRYRL